MSGDTPFWALNVMGNVPAVPAAGVPLSTPVVELNVTPLGKFPLTESDGGGTPVAVMVNELGVPIVNVALEPLVITGEAAAATVSAKL